MFFFFLFLFSVLRVVNLFCLYRGSVVIIIIIIIITIVIVIVAFVIIIAMVIKSPLCTVVLRMKTIWIILTMNKENDNSATEDRDGVENEESKGRTSD